MFVYLRFIDLSFDLKNLELNRKKNPLNVNLHIKDKYREGIKELFKQ